MPTNLGNLSDIRCHDVLKIMGGPVLSSCHELPLHPGLPILANLQPTTYSSSVSKIEILRFFCSAIFTASLGFKQGEVQTNGCSKVHEVCHP